jgi:hypothetical protein
MEKGLEDIVNKVEMLAKKDKEADDKKKKDGEKQGKVEKDIIALRKELEEIKKKTVGTEEMEKVRLKVNEVEKETEGVKVSFAEILTRGETGKDVGIDTKKDNGDVCIRAIERNEQMRMMEMIEREKRRSNLILFGIPEEGNGGDGLEIVKDVINGLLGTDVAYEVVGRVGKKGDKPRPIRIKVEDGQMRKKILTYSKRLKDTAGKESIYISPDLTRQQQEEDRKLREEVKLRRTRGESNVRISGGAVIGGKDDKDGNGVGVAANN